LAAPPKFESFEYGFNSASNAYASNSSNATVSCAKNSSCVGKGASCGGFVDLTTLETYNCSLNSSGTPNCCASGLYCISGKCAIDNAGATCTTGVDCYPSVTAFYPLNCVGGICTYVGYAGDKCTNGSQCANNLPCNNSVCTAPSVGQACNLTSGCGFGAYCGSLNGSLQCINYPQNGSCYANSKCYPGNFCNNGTCAALFSLGQGANCMGDSNRCQTGFICAPNNNTCQTAETSLTTCTNDSDCSSGVCLCSPFSGKQYCDSLFDDPCTSQRQSLDSCLVSNNCTHDGDGTNTCSYANCYSEYKKSNSCGCSIASTKYSSCFYNPYCGGFPVWAIIVIIVVIIVLILAVVLIVFFLMRRRRQYDTI